MNIEYNVQENVIKTEYQYEYDLFDENKKFLVLTIGTDSYIGTKES